MTGPHWIKQWISNLSLLNEQFRREDGSVDFEALGREEYAFRTAIITRKFEKSPRAKEVFEEALETYNKTTERARKGGLAKAAKNNGDADTREGSDESTTVSKDMGRVPQNGTHPRIQGGDRGAQAAMSPSPSGTAQDGNNFESAIAEAMEKVRTGGDSVRRVGVASPAVCHKSAGAPVRNSGRRFRNKEEYMQWAIDSGLDATDASECWDATLERGGKDADGNVVKSIKAFAVKWCKTRAENRRKTA